MKLFDLLTLIATSLVASYLVSLLVFFMFNLEFTLQIAGAIYISMFIYGNIMSYLLKSAKGEIKR